MRTAAEREQAERLAGLRFFIEAELDRLAPGLLSERPVEDYLAAFDALPERALYHVVPEAAKGRGQEIDGRGGAEALEAYLRLAIVALVERGVPAGEIAVPDEFLTLRRQWLDGVLAALPKPRKGYYRHSNDAFAKDFAVCRGKLWPGGVELVDPAAGVPRRLLLAGGPARAPSALAFFLGRMGGFGPVCDLHFDRRLIAEFDEQGYVRLWLRLASLLELNPHLRGIVSISWWHDPELSRISPELGFIGRHPERSGARLFRFGEGAVATADATRFGPRRRDLWRSGDYRPCMYLLAWARSDLLGWAAQHREG